MRLGTGLALALAAAGAAAGASPAGAAVVLQDGHVDYGARLLDGRLRAQVKDGTAGASAVVWREPADVVFHVRRAAATVVPSRAGFAFLGAPGAPLWLLPQVQQQGLLWPGWNTEEIGAEHVSGTLGWSLDAVDGPGRFALFTAGSFGEVTKLFDSGDGLPDTAQIPVGTHAHGNWAFSAEGRYRLTFTTRATLAPSGGASDTQTLTVTVGDVDPATGEPLPRAVPPPAGPPPGTVPGPAGGGREPGGTTGGGGTSADRGGAGAGSGSAVARPRLTLAASKPRLSGRTLTLRLRVGVRSRVRATVVRGKHVVARSTAPIVSPRARAVRLRLNRGLPSGSYRVRVVASAGGRSTVRLLTLRTPGRAQR
ncbi:choice-of-anchor M domain-containing protein [Conexibacter sp. CPCC 206217]|uniref:choice-of-anchor M domain-containing protein n=1 Tax=Conexibacter sp. CPCC 206217 TaxID=3064574 RepID=UPI00271DB0F5|nr:choice-of-anchor M domain-containing protein [Conexibacter sp. CPCC 206217]MDO8213119.1 choice-of-anchor M domain-containing protein [Conexibacter sp. CPCC 206217]